jgi:hypothetical protein
MERIGKRAISRCSEVRIFDGVGKHKANSGWQASDSGFPTYPLPSELKAGNRDRSRFCFNQEQRGLLLALQGRDCEQSNLRMRMSSRRWRYPSPAEIERPQKNCRQVSRKDWLIPAIPDGRLLVVRSAYCAFSEIACTEYAGISRVVVKPDPCAVRATEEELIIAPFTTW